MFAYVLFFVLRIRVELLEPTVKFSTSRTERTHTGIFSLKISPASKSQVIFDTLLKLLFPQVVQSREYIDSGTLYLQMF